MIKGAIGKGVRGIRSAGTHVRNFHQAGLQQKKQFVNQGKQAARDMPRSVDLTKHRAMAGKGLSTMKAKRGTTTMVVGAGMGVAAAMRNTGPGTSSGSNSFYRY